MILFVGHNYHRKGVPFLIRALPALRKLGTPFRALVLGRGRRSPATGWRGSSASAA